MSTTTINVATVVESIYVDLLFAPSESKPFSTSTVVVSTDSVLNRAQSSSSSPNSMSTATLLQLMTSTNTLKTPSSQLQPSSTTPALIDKVSEGQNASSAIVALAIGLPLAIFCLGFCFIVFYLWMRKRSYSRYSSTPTFAKSAAPAPRRESKIWTRLFNPEPSYHTDPFQHPYDEKSGTRSFVSLHEGSATIKYKITSNPTLHHVQTPQKVAFPVNKSYSSNQINTMLYSKPPRIQSIASAMPNSSSDPEAERPNLLAAGSWTYESPLSRWFLTKSTYLQDQVRQPLKSSTVKLKQLNILSRVSKNRIQSYLPDEKSPILSSGHSPVFQDSYVKSKLDPLVLRSSSLNHSGKQVSCDPKDRDTRYLKSGEISKLNPYSHSANPGSVIKPQIIDRSDASQRVLLKPLEIQRAPPKSGDHGKRVYENDGKLKPFDFDFKQHLDTLDLHKPLPLTPKSRQASENLKSTPDTPEEMDADHSSIASDVGLHEIHLVVRSYSHKLPDEISIRRHDYVRLLARHTDGWCLVEKCEPDGNPGYEKEEPECSNIDGRFYLNDYRGIVPGVCLKQVT
ncbi:LAFA_0G01354g1_1 [Lachancea sp. 'fantastica']|nr:LAFA_0G01354g1_1 [Lachancea sp. 'fantastica']